MNNFTMKSSSALQTDAIVKIVKTTICGTDLGILHGKTPSVKPGTTLDHKGV
jgi:alcohol dehydrogenase